ncbi:MAG: saccharopine dehydrogenase NADP-binding domain-containing protein [Bacteroidota bacterium]
MKNKTILILGGYGATGRVISRLLLKETDVNIIIAGRSIEKANELSAVLNKEYPDNRTSACFADASDYQSLLDAFKVVSMVLVASATTQHVKHVAEAALYSGIDYLDIHYQQNIVPVLNELVPKIENSGLCFITQAGFHPGLPSVFVRHAAPHFDQYKKAIIAMAMNIRIEKSESIYEIVDEISDYKADIFKDGKWKRGDYKDVKKIDLGPFFGVRPCFPIQLEEMRPLPGMFHLEDTGVYVAGFNWFVDNIVFPLAMILNKIKKGFGRDFIASLMVWGINTFSPSRLSVYFVLEAEGEKQGKPVKVRISAEHEEGYDFTAIPVVALILQYLDGTIKKPGLWMMGHLVDTGRLMNDMERMGVEIEVLITD